MTEKLICQYQIDGNDKIDEIIQHWHKIDEIVKIIKVANIIKIDESSQITWNTDLEKIRYVTIISQIFSFVLIQSGSIFARLQSLAQNMVKIRKMSNFVEKYISLQIYIFCVDLERFYTDALSNSYSKYRQNCTK